MPTLWRHLIRWPELIEQIHNSCKLLHENGVLKEAIEAVRVFVEEKSPALSRYKRSPSEIPDRAVEMINGYIGRQPSVSRMFTVGRSTELWLSGLSH